MEGLNLSNILGNTSFIDKLYDSGRVVNPITKRVIEGPIGKNCNLGNKCYSFWGQGLVCTNCISIRAYNENNTFLKVEYTGEKIFLITAIPVEIEGNKLVVELLKDITHSGIIEGINRKCPSEIYSLLQRQNELLMKDELTNVYNRRFINERLLYEIAFNLLKKRHLSVIVTDIDHFKKVNDTYGHIFGDEVLKIFAEELKKAIRQDKDWVARFGGEEFLICLPNTNLMEAFEIADRIRKNIEKLEIQVKDTQLQITTSFGIYSTFGEELGVEELIDLADKNLYQAKNQGRNCVKI